MVETVSFLDFLETIGVLAAVIFVLSSMLGMGFSLTVQQIIEPLKNIRLVLLSLVANFLLVPLLALVLLLIFPLSEGLSIGLFILGPPQELRSCRNSRRWRRGISPLQWG
jgi:BASS family bile acid:Na+ symporter